MSRKIRKKQSKKPGLAPGTLIYVGDKKAESVGITVIDYDEQNYVRTTVQTVQECTVFKDSATTTWINIDGLHQTEVIEQLGKQFDLHPLVLEDVLNTHQRAKAQEHENYVFVVLRMIRPDGTDGRVFSEQVSLVLGRNYVISFQECPGDVFDPVRERLENTKWRIRKLGPDYLLYSLIDSIVDYYFIVLEHLGDEIEDLEDQVTADPSEKVLQQIHDLKREMLELRKSVWPMRELVQRLSRSETSLIQEGTEVYLRDVYDHVIQVIDSIETYREMLMSMQDLYLSSISNKMNSVMKVLTIFASIFIPLTFIVGIYGMNFKYMPELECRWAYPAVWGVMIALVTILLLYFRKKKWL